MAVARVVSFCEARTRKTWGNLREEWEDVTFPPEGSGEPSPSALLWVWAGGLYLGIVLLAVRSLVLAPEGSWIGGGEIEGWLWRYWWMKQLIAGAWLGSGPLGALYVALVSGSYPEFGNLLDLQVLSWPLESVFGTPGYYNLKVGLVLLLNCLACWWFLSRIWGAQVGSWLGGLLFGLNPYFVFEISNGRMRQAVAFAIPLFILFLYRSWRHGGGRPTLLAGVFLGITAAFYFYYGVFLGLFCLLFLVWHVCSGRHRPHAPGFLLRMLGIVAIGVIFSAPFGLFYLEEAFGPNVLEVAPYGTAFPALEEMTAPQGTTRPENLLAGSQRRFLRESLPLDALWNPRLPHALPLAMLALVFFPWGVSRRVPWLWLATFLGFLVLSFGPLLSLGESFRVYLPWLPMPYLLFYRWVPLFSRLFAPGRLEVLVYLALAVLVCLRVKDLAGRRPGLGLLVACLAATGMWAQMEETRVLPFPTVRLGVAPYYYLLGDRPPFSLIEVPYRTGDYLEFNQTVHGQRSLGSFAQSGVPPGYPPGHQAWLAGKFEDPGNSFVAHLEALNREPTRPEPYREEDLDSLVQDGYRLLILHERGCYYLDRDGGERLYFALLEHFRKQLGDPVLHTDEPVHAGLLGRQRLDDRDPAWYRMAVFRLQDQEGRKTARRTLQKP
jgi:hypothetical protein